MRCEVVLDIKAPIIQKESMRFDHAHDEHFHAVHSSRAWRWHFERRSRVSHGEYSMQPINKERCFWAIIGWHWSEYKIPADLRKHLHFACESPCRALLSQLLYKTQTNFLQNGGKRIWGCFSQFPVSLSPGSVQRSGVHAVGFDPLWRERPGGAWWGLQRGASALWASHQRSCGLPRSSPSGHFRTGWVVRRRYELHFRCLQRKWHSWGILQYFPLSCFSPCHWHWSLALWTQWHSTSECLHDVILGHNPRTKASVWGGRKPGLFASQIQRRGLWTSSSWWEGGSFQLSKNPPTVPPVSQEPKKEEISS